jgi:hypothetical protein
MLEAKGKLIGIIIGLILKDTHENSTVIISIYNLDSFYLNEVQWKLTSIADGQRNQNPTQNKQKFGCMQPSNRQFRYL